MEEERMGGLGRAATTTDSVASVVTADYVMASPLPPALHSEADGGGGGGGNTNCRFIYPPSSPHFHFPALLTEELSMDSRTDSVSRCRPMWRDCSSLGDTARVSELCCAEILRVIRVVQKMPARVREISRAADGKCDAGFTRPP